MSMRSRHHEVNEMILRLNELIELECRLELKYHGALENVYNELVIDEDLVYQDDMQRWCDMDAGEQMILLHGSVSFNDTDGHLTLEVYQGPTWTWESGSWQEN